MTASPALTVSRDYPIVESLEAALRISTALLVRIVSKEICITPHGDRLLTWYKAEIMENIINAVLPDSKTATDSGLIPPGALGLVRSISEDASVTFQGPQQADKSENQVIRWMGQVRSNLEPRLKN